MSLSPALAGAPRDFHQVLEGLLNDWEIELRLGTLPRVPPRILLRKPQLSRDLPPSFAHSLEHAIAQRALRALPSQIRLSSDSDRIRERDQTGDRPQSQAAPHRTSLDPTASPQSDLETGEIELQSRLSYTPESMLLTLTTVEPESRAVIWTRTYSSEVPRLQMEAQVPAEKVEEYVPHTEHHVLGLVTVERTAAGATPCLGVGWRSMKRFWNRKAEWGFEADFLRETGTLLGTAIPPGSLFSTYHLGLLVMGTWNFIGDRDDPNRFRLALNTGIGGAFASGFLSAHARTALEVRIAKSSALSLLAGYRAGGVPLVGSNSEIDPRGGLQWGVAIHVLF